MSGIAVAMSGIRAATARLEVSAENLVNQQSLGALPGPDSTPPLNPHATPAPKVYRPIRANLYSLDHSSGGGVGVRYRQAAPGHVASQGSNDQVRLASAADAASEMVEQSQASLHYRASLTAMQRLQDAEKSVLDILA